MSADVFLLAFYPLVLVLLALGASRLALVGEPKDPVQIEEQPVVDADSVSNQRF